jgi:ribosomal protein L34E
MDDPALTATCARCGTPFQCGVDAPEGCWCARLPVLPAGALVPDSGCLCETCLRELIDARAASAGAAR